MKSVVRIVLLVWIRFIQSLCRRGKRGLGWSELSQTWFQKVNIRDILVKKGKKKEDDVNFFLLDCVYGSLPALA